MATKPTQLAAGARARIRRKQVSGERRKVTVAPHAAPLDQRRVLVLIGNGMVSQRFCERAAELGLPATRRLIVFGEERLPAYNRVQLTRVLSGQEGNELIIRPPIWYAERGIELRLAERVVSIDRVQRQVLTSLGYEQAYDELVFATGSCAASLPIVGASHPGVFTYRTMDDARRIGARALALAREHARVVVIGTGLLGVEAGQAMAALGCDVTFVEAAPQLLPRQLDAGSASIVAQLLLEDGYDLCLGQNVERITLMSEVRRPLASVLPHEDVPDTRLRVELGAGLRSHIDCGMVVLAAGVKPRDELARASGLACPSPGGIAVDSALMTHDPHVFAIGECARYAGRCAGLVAPGYAMAEVLAERLSGQSSIFSSSQPSTRFEVARRKVLVIGDGPESGRVPAAEASGAVANEGGVATIVQHHDVGSYRRLLIDNGRIVGLTAIGEGDDLARLQDAIALRSRFGSSDLRRLASGRRVRLPQAGIAAWPDAAIICDCTGVTCGALRRAHDEGHRSVAQLSAHTGAGSVCGSCRPRLSAFCTASEPPRWQVGLFVVSLSALALLSLGVYSGPIPLDNARFASAPLERLWRDHLARELSGYALAATVAASALTVALAKRRARRSGVPLHDARGVHALLGMLSVLGLGLHTGARWGRGLDLALAACLLLLVGVGATTSLGLLNDSWFVGRRGLALKRFGLRLHLWIAWPVPALLAIHILKSYYF
jgi:nitrite reductase (NADH) large subunit